MPPSTATTRRRAAATPRGTAATPGTPAVAGARTTLSPGAPAPPSAAGTSILACFVILAIALLSAGGNEAPQPNPAWQRVAALAALGAAPQRRPASFAGTPTRLAALPAAAVGAVEALVSEMPWTAAAAAGALACCLALAALAWAAAAAPRRRGVFGAPAAGCPPLAAATPAPLIPWLATEEEEEGAEVTGASGAGVSAESSPGGRAATTATTTATTTPGAASPASGPLSPLGSASAWLSGLAAEAGGVAGDAVTARDGALAVAADLEKAFGLAAAAGSEWGGGGGGRGGLRSGRVFGVGGGGGGGPADADAPPSEDMVLIRRAVALNRAGPPGTGLKQKKQPLRPGRVIGGPSPAAAAANWRFSSPDENADPVR